MLAGAHCVFTSPPIALVGGADTWSPKTTSFLSVLQVGHLIAAMHKAKRIKDRKGKKSSKETGKGLFRFMELT